MRRLCSNKKFARPRTLEEVISGSMRYANRHGQQKKLQIPTSKLQGVSRLKSAFGNLNFGGSLDVGAWNLELNHLTRPGSEKGIHQFGQFVAVTAFQYDRSRDMHFSQPFSECRKIFGLECHLNERITCIGIESRRNEQ
jgi:hypothetical protein